MYAGAVMVLYVFVVAYIGGGDQPLIAGGGALKVLGPLFAFAVAVELCIAVLGSALRGIKGHGAPYVIGFGSPEQIGRLFLTTYLFPFEAASLLLLVAPSARSCSPAGAAGSTTPISSSTRDCTRCRARLHRHDGRGDWDPPRGCG